MFYSDLSKFEQYKIYYKNNGYNSIFEKIIELQPKPGLT